MKNLLLGILVSCSFVALGMSESDNGSSHTPTSNERMSLPSSVENLQQENVPEGETLDLKELEKEAKEHGRETLLLNDALKECENTLKLYDPLIESYKKERMNYICYPNYEYYNTNTSAPLLNFEQNYIASCDGYVFVKGSVEGGFTFSIEGKKLLFALDNGPSEGSYNAIFLPIKMGERFIATNQGDALNSELRFFPYEKEMNRSVDDSKYNNSSIKSHFDQCKQAFYEFKRKQAKLGEIVFQERLEKIEKTEKDNKKSLLFKKSDGRIWKRSGIIH